MKNHFFILSVIFSLSAACSLAYAADKGDEHTGEETLSLNHYYAVTQEGSRSEKDDKTCAKKLDAQGSLFAGLKIKTTYKINSKTHIQSATSWYIPAGKLKPEMAIELHPLGISGVYKFMGNQPGTKNNVYFSLDDNFKHPASQVLVVEEGAAFNCVASSTIPAEKL